MQAYRVGGSVRDELLGLPVADRDWVVVGATPQEMIEAGFRPVGKDFPVFLHPRTREEYALARTERKTGPGYRGFAVHFEPGVTLEEDLARRDLTINAIAQDVDGSITDPFDGRRDLADRVLRHVSASFSEDPVRILRLARFAARFADFRIAPETMKLMRQMTAAGEADALVPERVWQELARGLQEGRPSRMIAVLQEAGALRVLMPELESAASARGWDDWLEAIDRCARRGESLAVTYAVFVSPAGPRGADGSAEVPDLTVMRLSRSLRAPGECRDLAALLARESAVSWSLAQADILEALSRISPRALLELLERSDAWRRPGRVTGLLRAAAAISGADPDSHPGALRLQRALAAAKAVDQANIARRHPGRPEEIRDAIAGERLRSIARQA